MPVLRVLNARGDTSVAWDARAFATGDPEARAAVAEAERIFATARAAGAEAFRLRDGSPAERLLVLDPTVDEDVMVIPRMVGG